MQSGVIVTPDDDPAIRRISQSPQQLSDPDLGLAAGVQRAVKDSFDHGLILFMEPASTSFIKRWYVESFNC